ncbi:hypothetical protein GQ457_12G011060 [Hibiscus cannabinus]
MFDIVEEEEDVFFLVSVEASKCITLHPHLFLHCPILQNPIFSRLAPTPLSSAVKTAKFKTTSTHTQIYHSFPKRCVTLTTRASSGKSSGATMFGEFEPDPTLTNDDLKPTTPNQRNFHWWEMASLWIGLVVGVPSYYMAGSLVDLGMAWSGNFPSPIKQSSFSQLLPWLGTSPLEFACFIAFWLAQLAMVWKGMEGIRDLEKYSAPILIILTSMLLIWAYVKAAGLGHMLALSSRLSSSEFWSLFFPSLTANISFWATVALNIPDFTRFAKTQRDQIIGQAGLPFFMGAFTFVGIAVTSSTQVIFGQVISNPIQLLGQIGGFTTMILAILGISIATITTNTAANIVAPANTLVNLSPSNFTFRRGALLTALLGIAFQPWRQLKSSESFVYTWLVGYSALLGPIGGIILADYYLIQRTNLIVQDLYSSSPGGAYYYSGGVNLAAMAALVIAVLPVVPGFLQKVEILYSVPDAFVVIYNNAWFFSFFSAGLVYWILASLRRKQDKHFPFDPLLPTTS